MGRDDDYARRRLRQVYEQNKRRVKTLAEARGEDKPARFVVKERRSRVAGVGAGRLQATSSGRAQQRQSRFKDTSAFKSRRVVKAVQQQKPGNNGGKRFNRNNTNDRQVRNRGTTNRNNQRGRDHPKAARGTGGRGGRGGRGGDAGARPQQQNVEDAFSRYVSGEAPVDSRASNLNQQLEQYKLGPQAPAVALDKQLESYFGPK